MEVKTIWYLCMLVANIWWFYYVYAPLVADGDWATVVKKLGQVTYGNHLNQTIYFLKGYIRSIRGTPHSYSDLVQLYVFMGISPTLATGFWYFYLTDLSFWGLPYYDWWSEDWMCNHIQHTLIVLPIFIEPLVNSDLNLKRITMKSILGYNLVGILNICLHHRLFYLYHRYTVYPWELKAAKWFVVLFYGGV